MMIRRTFNLIVVMIVSLVAVAVLVTSCAGGAVPPAEPTVAPTQAPEPTAAPTEEAEPTTAPTQAPDPEPTAASTEEAEPTATPTQTPEPTTAPTEEAESSGGSTRIDLDAIFPPGPGREMSLNVCSACHNFVPLVILQLDETQWDYVLRDHRERVPMVSDEDYQLLQDYLTENFGPDDPVPELPQELLDQWTSY